MPFVVRKVRNQQCWRVKNTNTGKIHAKCTSKAKAEAQLRILQLWMNKKNKVR